MKDLQGYVNHPAVQNGDALILVSNQPPALIKGDEKKAMGQALPTQTLIGLLKASLPAEVMSQFGWGKELTPGLQVGDHSLPMKIILTPDKAITIEIQLKASSSQPAPAEAAATPESAATPANEAKPEKDPPADEQERVTEPDPDPPALPAIAEADEEQFQKQLDALSGGDQVGLICHAPGMDPAPMANALKELGFQPRMTNHPTVCMEALKYNSYPILILMMDEAYRQNPLYLNYIELNMESRRSQYAVLVAPGLTTGDTMLAFSLSVNFTLAPEALDAAAAHLKKGMTAWQRFVSGFHEFLEAAGRL